MNVSEKKVYDRKRYLSKKPYFRALNVAYRSSVKGRAIHLHTAAKHRAKGKKVAFDLHVDWVKRKVEAGVCEVTGIQFCLETRIDGRKHPFGPSIDRIDNSKGYSESNCRMVVWALNAAISDFGEETYALVAAAFLKKKQENSH